MLDFNPSNDERYAYAVGVVRSLEVKFLRKNHWGRLIDSKNEEDIFSVLSDTPYITLRKHTVEQTLEEAENENEDLFKRMILDEKIIEFFVLDIDYYNLKVLLREEIFNTSLKKKEGGRYSPEEIKKALKGEKVKMNNTFLYAVAEGFVTGVEKKDPLFIDLTVDKFLFKEKKEIARSYSFLSSFLKIYLDTENIRNFMRFYISENKEIIPNVILEGGIMEKEFFVKAKDDSLENFITQISKKGYGFIQDAIFYFDKTKSFLKLEKEIKKFLNHWLWKTRYLTFGYEPIITYYLYKREEIKSIRKITIGIKANLPKEEIKEGVWQAE